MVRANFLLVSLHENHGQEERSLPEGISESTDEKGMIRNGGTSLVVCCSSLLSFCLVSLLECCHNLGAEG